MTEFNTLDWFLYGSETKAFISTMLHLTVVGAVGWAVGTYVLPPVMESLRKSSNSSNQARDERVVYAVPQPQAAIGGPSVQYAEVQR